MDNNKLIKRKIQTYEIVLCIFVLCVIAAGLFMPKAGPLVMIDEICDVLAIWTACIYVSVRIIRGIRDRGPFPASVKAARIFVIAVCVVIGVLFARSTALDLVSGPETAQLTDIQVSRFQAHTGTFSLHYYLMGTDSQGERVRLEISGDDYARLSGSSSVTVEYYRHTGRIVRYIDGRMRTDSAEVSHRRWCWISRRGLHNRKRWLAS